MKPFTRRILACNLIVLTTITCFAEQSRTLSGTFPTRVEISVVPPEGTNAWTVEETLTAGAVSVELSGEGIFDEENGKAKWGPFLDDGPRILSYLLTGPAGEVAIDGTVSFDGVSEVIDTMDVVVLPDPESNFSGWRYLTLSGELLHTLAAHPLSDLNLDGYNLLQEYAFGLFVPGIVDRPVILNLPGLPVPPPDGNLSYYRNRKAMDLEFTLQEHDPIGGWIAVDFAGTGVTPMEISLGNTDQVSEVIYQAIPLTGIEGTFLRVLARLQEP